MEKDIDNFLKFCKNLVQKYVIKENFLEADGSLFENKEMSACETYLFYNIVKYNMQSQYISSETNFSFLGDLSHDEIRVLENIVLNMKEDLKEKILYPKIKNFLNDPRDKHGNPSMMAPTEEGINTIRNKINEANRRGKDNPLGENTILTAEYFLNSFLNLLSKAKFYNIGFSDINITKNEIARIKGTLNGNMALIVNASVKEIATKRNFKDFSDDARYYSRNISDIIPQPTPDREREIIKRNNQESECYVAAFKYLIHCKEYFDNENFNNQFKRSLANTEKKKRNADYQEKKEAAKVIDDYRTKAFEQEAARILPKEKRKRNIDEDLIEFYERLTRGEKDAKNLLNDFAKDTGIELN